MEAVRRAITWYDDYTDNWKFSFDRPLSSVPLTIGTLVLYPFIMYGFNNLLGTVPSEKRADNFYHSFLRKFNIFHNAVMWVISVVCFLGTLHSALDIAFLRPERYGNNWGMYGIICDPDAKHQDGKLLFWDYVYFLSKYVELIDTLLIVLRQSKLRFIHTYHHVFTMFTAYWCLWGRATGPWVIIMVNALVHVVMYYYYLLTCFGKTVWWKMYLTDFQLTQFVIDLIMLVYYLYANNFIERPKGGKCTGHNFGASVGAFMIGSYLILFYRLRQQNAKAEAKKRAAKKEAEKKKDE